MMMVMESVGRKVKSRKKRLSILKRRDEGKPGLMFKKIVLDYLRRDMVLKKLARKSLVRFVKKVLANEESEQLDEIASH
jgi:hypothetical protein